MKTIKISPNHDYKMAFAALKEAGYRLSLPNEKLEDADLAFVYDENTEVNTCKSGLGCDGGGLVVDPYDLLKQAGFDDLDQALYESIKEDSAIDFMATTLNWSMVEVKGEAAFARAPSRGTQSGRTLLDVEDPDCLLDKLSLKELASFIFSLDELKRSIALAAISAYHAKSYKENEPNWGFKRIAPQSEGVLIFGAFREALKRFPTAKIVEREPKPGDLSVEQGLAALKDAKHAVITGQALVNGSLRPLLKRAGFDSGKVSAKLMLLGPSAPLAPVIHDFGIDASCTMKAKDIEKCKRFIQQTGTKLLREDLATFLVI